MRTRLLSRFRFSARSFLCLYFYHCVVVVCVGMHLHMGDIRVAGLIIDKALSMLMVILARGQGSGRVERQVCLGGLFPLCLCGIVALCFFFVWALAPVCCCFAVFALEKKRKSGWGICGLSVFVVFSRLVCFLPLPRSFVQLGHCVCPYLSGLRLSSFQDRASELYRPHLEKKTFVCFMSCLKTLCLQMQSV